MRKHIVKTRESTWIRRGFLKQEAYYLSELSRAGAKAPYILALRRHRSALLGAKAKYGWSQREFNKRVIKDYEKLVLPKYKGGSYKQYLKKHFYDLFELYKDKVPVGKEYKSPTKKDRRKYKIVNKPQKTMKESLQSKLDDNEMKIRQAIASGNQPERRRLEKERDIIRNRIR